MCCVCVVFRGGSVGAAPQHSSWPQWFCPGFGEWTRPTVPHRVRGPLSQSLEHSYRYETHWTIKSTGQLFIPRENMKLNAHHSHAHALRRANRKFAFQRTSPVVWHAVCVRRTGWTGWPHLKLCVCLQTVLPCRPSVWLRCALWTGSCWCVVTAQADWRSGTKLHCFTPKRWSVTHDLKFSFAFITQFCKVKRLNLVSPLQKRAIKLCERQSSSFPEWFYLVNLWSVSQSAFFLKCISFGVFFLQNNYI